jgi:hypothetical protein
MEFMTQEQYEAYCKKLGDEVFHSPAPETIIHMLPPLSNGEWHQIGIWKDNPPSKELLDPSTILRDQ